MQTHIDLPALLSAIAIGAEPVPQIVVTDGAAAIEDIDLEAYTRSALWPLDDG